MVFLVLMSLEIDQSAYHTTPAEVDERSMLPISPVDLTGTFRNIISLMKREDGLWRPFKPEEVVSSRFDVARLATAGWLDGQNEDGLYVPTPDLAMAADIKNGYYSYVDGNIYRTQSIGGRMQLDGENDRVAEQMVSYTGDYEHPVYGWHALWHSSLPRFHRMFEYIGVEKPSR